MCEQVCILFQGPYSTPVALMHPASGTFARRHSKKRLPSPRKNFVVPDSHQNSITFPFIFISFDRREHQPAGDDSWCGLDHSEQPGCGESVVMMKKARANGTAVRHEKEADG